MAVDGCGGLADARLVDGEPWTVKKYVDEVFSEGVGEDKLVANDGRHRVNPTVGYDTDTRPGDNGQPVTRTWRSNPAAK